MSNQSLWYLEQIDLSGLMCPKKVAMGGLDNQDHKTYAKGAYIYLPEEAADRIFLITEGRVKIGTYTEDGREITNAVLSGGEVFGELSLIGKEQRHDFAYAMEETTVCVMAVSDMQGMMREHSALGLFLLRVMGSRMLEMEQRLQSLVFKDSRTRVIEFLLELAAKRGQRVGYEMLVRKFLTHQEIANLTATSRQTVTTVLNELRNADILTFNRKRLLIRDMDRLRGAVEKSTT